MKHINAGGQCSQLRDPSISINQRQACAYPSLYHIIPFVAKNITLLGAAMDQIDIISQ